MLIDSDQLLLFIPAAIALNLTPGADMLFCLAQGARAGSKAGVAASLGIATGSVIHTLLAALGLAALLAAHPLAFELLRWAGVVYLAWLAIQSFRARSQPQDATRADASSSYGLLYPWRDGIVVNVLNPKVAVFILAFLPQFVDPANGSTVIQFLILGGFFNVSGTTINALVGIHAGKVGGFLAANRRARKLFHRLSGVVFLGLAAKLAFDRR